MLKRATQLLFLLAVATHASDETPIDQRLLGIWRFEDENSIEELAFYQDRSFRSLDRNKYELSTPGLGDWRGTWRAEGDRIHIDSALVYTPGDYKIRTGRYDSDREILLMKTRDGARTLNYTRLVEPSCLTESPSKVRTSEAQLLGAWKVHCYTHDYEYRFLRHGKLLVFSPEIPDPEPLFEMKWHVDGNTLIFDAKKHSARDQPKQAWPVLDMQRDCFRAKDIDGFTQTFVRLR
ncbi:MAG: hypothetical protein QOH88_482 [Verrucomicrobiota bacterium]|jgi:hypothetical protein